MRTFVVVAIALLLAASAWGQGEPKSVPPATHGGTASGSPGPRSSLGTEGRVYVGDVAPDFDLPSSRDRQVTLSHQRGDWVLLVFVADRNDFAALRTINDDLTAIGVRILGMCRDNPQSLRGTAQKEQIPFEMLADPTGEVSAMYGLYDQSHRMCVPGFLVLDRRGVVKLEVSGQMLPAAEILQLTRLTQLAP